MNDLRPLWRSLCCCWRRRAAARNRPRRAARRPTRSVVDRVEGRQPSPGASTFDGHRPGESADQDVGRSVLHAARTRTARRSRTSSSTNGGLENVFVYVKDGLGNYYFDVPTEPVKLDQQGCHYRPHVLGVRAGQPLAITNSDDTLHNVHAMPNANREFNMGQALKNMVDAESLHRARSDGAVQVRRAQLDARLRRRDGSSVLRGHARRREVRAEESAGRHLHGRGVAREARNPDRRASPSARRNRRKSTFTFKAPPPARTDSIMIWLHRYAKLVAASTVLLIAAGGMVTSTGSGLSVP